jgi:TetR/AcrR family transcriptional repressor of nem operon
MTTEAALLLFWQKGFEATTLEEITERTGINGSSLFAAYGNKHGLFMAALERYRAEVGARLEVLERGERGLEDLVAFIGWLADINTSGDRPLGCLMVNTMVEFGVTDPSVVEQVALYRQQLTDSIRATLVRASRLGEIPETTVATRTQLVRAGLFGALVVANVGSSTEVVDALDAVRLEVEAWNETAASARQPRLSHR